MKKRHFYFIITVTCFILCVFILIFFSNYPLIRGFIGDILITLLIYSFIKIFFDIKPIKLCIAILMFSFTIEFLQYIKLIDYIGLSESKIARIIIGTTFDYKDLIAYTIGIVIAYLLDKHPLNSYDR